MCPTVGAVCYGGVQNDGSSVSQNTIASGLSAKFGFYGFYWGEHTGTKSARYDVEMFQCPPFQCCVNKECAVNSTAECPSSRDRHVALCGRCIGALSEVLGSANCQLCKGVNWPVFLVGLATFSLVLWYLHRSAGKQAAACAVQESSSKPFRSTLPIILTTTLPYFYQVLALASLSHCLCLTVSQSLALAHCRVHLPLSHCRLYCL